MTDRLGILAPTDPFPVVIELRVFAEMVGIRGVAVVADHVDERCLSEIRELVAGGDAVAVIVFYCDTDPVQEAQALEAGADACIPVNFDWRYIVAHMRSIMARLRRASPPESALHSSIAVDPRTNHALIEGRRVTLSAPQFRFLFELRQQQGKVVPYERLERLIWGDAGPSSHQCLKQLAHRLRARLGPAAESIVCIPGVGYMLASAQPPATILASLVANS